MRYNLAALYRQTRNPRRSAIALRPVRLPATLASDLYAEAYRPVIVAWGEAIAPILASYERTLAEMVTDAPADTAVEISQVEARLNIAVIALTARLERWAARVEAYHRQRWRASVLTATGVDLATLIGPADMRLTLEAVVQRNVALVSSVSSQAKDRIADAVFRGFRERKPAAVVAREVRETVAMGRRRSLRIAGDQLVKLGASLDEERRREAGIMAWEWVHSGKLHPREDHKARNGLLYSDDPSDAGQAYQGKRVRKVPEDRPGQLPYCGCTSRAVVIL